MESKRICYEINYKRYDFPVFNPLERMPGYVGYTAGNTLIDRVNEDIAREKNREKKELRKRIAIIDKAIKKCLRIELLKTLELILEKKY